MKKNKVYVLVIVVSSLIFCGLHLWNYFYNYRHPVEQIIPMTNEEWSTCRKVKPEFNSVLINDGQRIYWTMKSGKIKVCIKNRKSSAIQEMSVSCSSGKGVSYGMQDIQGMPDNKPNK
jgi:hypothetical protein